MKGISKAKYSGVLLSSNSISLVGLEWPQNLSNNFLFYLFTQDLISGKPSMNWWAVVGKNSLIVSFFSFVILPVFKLYNCL